MGGGAGKRTTKTIMSNINPIIESSLSVPPMEVPQYVLDVRKLAIKLNGKKPKTKIFNSIVGTKEDGLKTELRDKYEKACKISGAAPFGQIRKRIRIPKTKISKQKTMTHKKIKSKQFNSLIDTDSKKTPESSTWGKKYRSIGQIMLSAQKDLKELIEISKIADQDVYFELIELKKKELGIIYNYIKRR